MTFISTARVYTKDEIETLRDLPGFGGDSVSDHVTHRALQDNRPAFWNLLTYHEAGLQSAGDLANKRGLLCALSHVRRGCEEAGATAAQRDALQVRLVSRLAPANPAGLAVLREIVDLLDIAFKAQRAA